MADEPKLCVICGTAPTGDNWMMCPGCFTRVSDTARDNPYGWMNERATGEPAESSVV